MRTARPHVFAGSILASCLAIFALPAAAQVGFPPPPPKFGFQDVGTPVAVSIAAIVYLGILPTQVLDLAAASISTIF